MIETILIFALGFFIAGFLALLAIPAVWRRAGQLAARRVRESLPLSANERAAEKDRMRADHAMAARKLEMSIESLNRKTATQLAEIGRLSEESRQLAEERRRQDEAIAALERETSQQRASLAERAGTIDDLSGRLEAARADVEARDSRIAMLESQYEETRFTASSQQIELAARESEVQKLEDELATLRNQRKQAMRDMREAVRARKEAQSALHEAEKRNGDLQRKLETMMTRLSDYEERLERRESEIARLRETEKERPAMTGDDDMRARLEAAEAERRRLEAELADKSLQIGSLLADDGGSGAPPADFSAERERLQSRIAALLKENKKLRAQAPAAKANGKGGEKSAEAGTGEAALRDKISTLAAEMVAMTAALEGPDSPIHAALSKADGTEAEGAPPSLAERVRRLRAAAGEAG